MKKKWMIPAFLLIFILAGYSMKENIQEKGNNPLSDPFVKDVSYISQLTNEMEQWTHKGYVEASGKDPRIDISALKKSEKTAKEILNYYHKTPSYQKETKYTKWVTELNLEMRNLTEAQGELSVYVNNPNEPTVLLELPSVIQHLKSITTAIQKIDQAISK